MVQCFRLVVWLDYWEHRMDRLLSREAQRETGRIPLEEAVYALLAVWQAEAARAATPREDRTPLVWVSAVPRISVSMAPSSWRRTLFTETAPLFQPSETEAGKVPLPLAVRLIFGPLDPSSVGEQLRPFYLGVLAVGTSGLDRHRGARAETA